MKFLIIMREYICVLDFEATCDDNKKFYPRNEIIEFPSVLLHYNPVSKKYQKISQIQLFCKPLYNVQLTQFCKDLTGITQSQVNNGIEFPVALQQHHNWLMTNTNYSNSVMIVTCGNWDLISMLPDECRRWNLFPDPQYLKVINLKHAFVDLYPKKRMGMTGMLEFCGLTLEGRHHSGIDDCNNIVKLFQHLTSKGAKWEKYVQKVDNSLYKVNGAKQSSKQNLEKVKQRQNERKKPKDDSKFLAKPNKNAEPFFFK